ncbi:tetratricopeptide repeat protein [Nisaea sp.]|uniref:tetratricopeptide repeat protein n=1 Tax=Nisaea sp. TaxID=2024842 RepID=UPI003B52C850
MVEAETRLADELRRTVSEQAVAGDWSACSGSARKLFFLIPGDPIAAYFLSLSTGRLGDKALSGRSARRACAAISRNVLVPLHRELFTLRGLADGSRNALRRAVLIAPEQGAGLFNLANMDVRQEAYGSASTLLRRANIARPLDPGTLGEIARIAGLLTDGAHAGTAFARALTLVPADFSTLRNTGLWQRKQDRSAEGARWFRRAVAVNPTSREAQGELGRALLSDGELAEGWDRLERFRMPRWRPPIDGLPRWDGGPVQDGALLLWSVDKVGDELLFSVFLERARQAAGRVIAVVDARNVALLSRLHPEIRVCATLPESDSADPGWRPVSGYPLEFAGRFFSRQPEEMACPGGHRSLPDRKGDRKGPLRVGISWKSDASLVGALKSTRLADWTPVFKHSNCQFYSLQYGDVMHDLDACPQVQRIPGFEPFGETLPFAETIADLDLVITVANTTAHVAGCTKTPLWVLLPTGFGCSWFWFRERSDSPLYAHARLFRQPVPGDWPSVFSALATELGRLAATRAG